MRLSFTQQEIFEILKENPLGIEVKIGNSNLENKDYIFCEFRNSYAIPSDAPVWKTYMIINILTKSYENRKTTVAYLMQSFPTDVLYTFDEKHEYYMATLRKEVFLHE